MDVLLKGIILMYLNDISSNHLPSTLCSTLKSPQRNGNHWLLGFQGHGYLDRNRNSNRHDNQRIAGLFWQHDVMDTNSKYYICNHIKKNIKYNTYNMQWPIPSNSRLQSCVYMVLSNMISSLGKLILLPLGPFASLAQTFTGCCIAVQCGS